MTGSDESDIFAILPLRLLYLPPKKIALRSPLNFLGRFVLILSPLDLLHRTATFTPTSGEDLAPLSWVQASSLNANSFVII
jgi:hypothetical protein